VIEWSGGIGVILLPIGAAVAVGVPIVTEILSYTVWNPLVSLVEYAAGVPYVTGTILLGLVTILIGGSLFTARKTGPAVDWSLSIRLVGYPLALVVVLIGFFVAVWRLIEVGVQFGLALVGIGPETSAVVADVVTVGLLATFVYLEYTRISTLEQHGDTSTVTSAEYPTLHAITTRVASQLDVPLPTIAVSHRSKPEAITIGYRPENITLILSEGLLDALDDEELEAVVAHELAHVANMDAMVMTAASLPRLFADGITNRALAIGSPDDDYGDLVGAHRSITKIGYKIWYGGPQNLVWVVVLIIPVLTKVVSLPFITALSRARESAADRTAATVIGSPAALAGALQTLGEQIEEMQSKDLREASALSSLSILPLHSIPTDISFEEFNGVNKLISIVLTTIAMMWYISFFGTHPPTDHRVETLSALTEKRETES
jgi:heat shock protein HtpX